MVELLAGEVRDTVGEVAWARETLIPQKTAQATKKHVELRKVWRKGRSHKRGINCGWVILYKNPDDVNEKPVDIAS
jgi:hypothetical protein